MWWSGAKVSSGELMRLYSFLKVSSFFPSSAELNFSSVSGWFEWVFVTLFHDFLWDFFQISKKTFQQFTECKDFKMFSFLWEINVNEELYSGQRPRSL